MAEIVNLRMARKARQRVEAAREADAARAKAGRSKAERELAARETARVERTLDGAKREKD